MKKVSGLTKIVGTAGIVVGSVLGSLDSPNKSNAGIIQLQLNSDIPASYVATKEMRDDVGATNNYDSGLDVLLDTSIVPGADVKFPVIYAIPSGQKVEYDFVPKPSGGKIYDFQFSVENRDLSPLLTNLSLKVLQFDTFDNPAISDFEYFINVDIDANGSYNDAWDFSESGILSDLYSSPTQSSQTWTQFTPGTFDHRNGDYNGTLTLLSLANQQSDDADFDNDNDVDGSDFLAWQRGFGTSSGATLADGDANYDGNVDSDDLDIWENQYGTISSPLSNLSGYVNGVGGIPEPSSIALAGLGALTLLGAGRRKNKGS